MPTRDELIFYSDIGRIADQLERIADALEKRNKVIGTHGDSSKCPQVQSGEWTRCMGHPGGV